MLAFSGLACQPTAEHEDVARAAGGDACEALSGQTIRFIVPFSAGGGYDVYARLLKPSLEEALGARIVVENRTGAGGRLGARVIRDADPDGRTLGLLNGYSLLVNELAEGATGLHPVLDFTVLGRIAPGDLVWVSRAGSGFTTIEDILGSHGTPILFGSNGVSSSGFVAASVAAELLGVDVSYIIGYPGTRESSLGLMRGEFDIGASTFESVRDLVDAGDLILLLQLSDVGREPHPALTDTPVLEGRDGLAARIARERGEDPARNIALAAAVAALFEVGRLVVGPPGLDPDLGGCLSENLARVARAPDFLAATERAQRVVDFAAPATLVAQLEASEAEWEPLTAIFRRHAELARGDRIR